MKFDMQKCLRRCIDDNPLDLRWEGPFLLGEIEKHPKLIKRMVGVYRFYRKGIRRVWYIGRAVEYKNGGLRKRLRDYVRKSDSARKSGIGPQAYRDRSQIQVWVMYVGDDLKAVLITRLLEWLLIRRLKPIGNKQL